MIGNPCSEFVAAASFAVRMGYTVGEFKQVVFPHPTVGEVLREVIAELQDPLIPPSKGEDRYKVIGDRLKEIGQRYGKTRESIGVFEGAWYCV